MDPKYCFPVFRDVHSLVQEWGLLERQYQSSLESYLVALDGTWFHSSEAIDCPKCLHKDHKDGRRTYYHSAITPVLVKPGNNRVISLEPEFIQPQDGRVKQDCEINAAKRWIAGAGKRYVPMGITLDLPLFPGNPTPGPLDSTLLNIYQNGSMLPMWEWIFSN